MPDTLAKALSFILVIVLGYFLKKIGKLHPNDFAVLSRIVMLVTLPCALLTNLNGIPVDTKLLFVFLLGILCNFATIAAGWMMTRNRPNGDRVFSMLNLSGFSIGLFAMPYVQQFLSPEGFLTVCLFDAGNAVMCTGLTFALSTRLYPCAPGDMKTPFFRTLFSSLPIWAYVLITILGLTGLSLPPQIIQFTRIAGDANSFLCMLMIGIVLELRLDPSRFRAFFSIWACAMSSSLRWLCCSTRLCPTPMTYDWPLPSSCSRPWPASRWVFTLRIQGDLVLAANISSGHDADQQSSS